MDYETIVKLLREKWKIRIARFIEMYYISSCNKDEIMKELYIESMRGWYSMRRRIRNIICTIIEDEKKIKKI